MNKIVYRLLFVRTIMKIQVAKASGIQRGLINRLIDNNIVLLKDLVSMEIQEMRSMLSLPEKKALILKQQAEELCLCG